MLTLPGPVTTLLFKGGPSLIDLMIDATQLRIEVTGPRMLFESLEFVTTLSAFEGCTFQRLEELAQGLEGTIHCGLIGVASAEIRVESVRSGGLLQIDLGPASMYQSLLVLQTRSGETFRDLIRRTLSDDPTASFFAGLHATIATGHLEHSHGGDHPDEGDDHPEEGDGDPDHGGDHPHTHGQDPQPGNHAPHVEGGAHSGGHSAHGHSHDPAPHGGNHGHA